MKLFIRNNLNIFIISLLVLFFRTGNVISQTHSQKHENVVILYTPLVNIIFDGKDGLPLSYELLRLKEQFKGKDDGQTIKVVLSKKNRDNTLDLKKTANGEYYMKSKTDMVVVPHLKKIDILKDQANVSYEVYSDNSIKVSFTIRYSIKDETVFITLEDVIERNGYELIEIQTNSLVTIYQTNGNEWLAHGNGGGYYSDLASARSAELNDGWSKEFPYFPNFTYLPLVMMGNGKVNSSMEVQGYLSNTKLKVSRAKRKKKATMGVRSYYRVGGESIDHLLAGQKEICRIDFTGDHDKNKKTDWLDAAKAVRDHMPPIPTHYLDDKMVWLIMGQKGRAEKAEITFTDIVKVIKRISMLTDGVPQVVYIAGWTEGGHDTGYPNITKLNDKMGGLEGFKQLKEKALLYNANISFDDNYDDQYNNEYTRGYFNEKYIARNADGSLMRQKAWNGVDTSYITGMAKYMQDGGPGKERVRFTCQNYDLKHTELVDALSWWSIRHDWDPESPASAIKNLRNGKFELIRAYKKYGIDIISELLRYPFVGKLALVVDGPEGEGWNDFKGTQIPLQRLVYSNSIIYGSSGGEGVARDPRLTLFQNCRRGPWIKQTTSAADITDYYYLNFLPWTKLHALDILSFHRDKKKISMKLSNNSSVEIDYQEDDKFSVVYNKIKIMDGNSITCPIDNNRIAFYSKRREILSYPVPRGKDPGSFKAKLLSDDKSENYPFKVKNGKIIIHVPENHPVILYH